MTEVSRKRKIYIYLRSLLVVIVVVSGVVTIAGTAYIVILIRSSQQSNKITQQSNLKLTQTIVGCTTPGGKCYEDSRSQTSNAVNSISQVVIATKFCGNQLPKTASITDITACVQKALEGN